MVMFGVFGVAVAGTGAVKGRLGMAIAAAWCINVMLLSFLRGLSSAIW